MAFWIVGQVRFWNDFGMIGWFWGSFSEPKWDRNGFKHRSKDDGFWDRSWKGSGAPNGGHAPVRVDRQGSTGKGREGVKTLPWGMRGYGLWDCWKEDASKPPAAQRAGGI